MVTALLGQQCVRQKSESKIMVFLAKEQDDRIMTKFGNEHR